jgi:hypothetical protein
VLSHHASRCASLSPLKPNINVDILEIKRFRIEVSGRVPSPGVNLPTWSGTEMLPVPIDTPALEEPPVLSVIRTPMDPRRAAISDMPITRRAYIAD